MDAISSKTRFEQLITRGIRADAARFLVEEYSHEVFGLCRSMVKDRTLAEDLSQDVFIKALGALDSFRGEAAPRTWLLRIARNHCLDHLKSTEHAVFRAADPEVDEQEHEEPTIDVRMIQSADARAALDCLSQEERAIVVLHLGHGVGYPEIADAFSMREGAVRMRLSRALKKMREAIQLRDQASPPPPQRASRARAEMPSGAAPRRHIEAGPATPIASSPPAPRAPQTTSPWDAVRQFFFGAHPKTEETTVAPQLTEPLDAGFVERLNAWASSR